MASDPGPSLALDAGTPIEVISGALAGNRGRIAGPPSGGVYYPVLLDHSFGELVLHRREFEVDLVPRRGPSGPGRGIKVHRPPPAGPTAESMLAAIESWRQEAPDRRSYVVTVWRARATDRVTVDVILGGDPEPRRVAFPSPATAKLVMASLDALDPGHAHAAGPRLADLDAGAGS